MEPKEQPITPLPPKTFQQALDEISVWHRGKPFGQLSRHDKDLLNIIREAAEVFCTSQREAAFNQGAREQKEICSGSPSDFEKDLYDLVNRYVDAGLKKPDLIHKMEYVTQSCRVS